MAWGKSVGTKTRQWLTIVPMDYGTHFEIATHREVHSLHPTKGWRLEGRSKHVQLVRKLPSWNVQRKANFTVFQGNKTVTSPTEIETGTGTWLNPGAKERALMRHGWYRRKLRKEAAAQQIAAG